MRESMSHEAIQHKYMAALEEENPDIEHLKVQVEYINKHKNTILGVIKFLKNKI